MDERVREKLLTTTMLLTLEKIIDRFDATADRYEKLFDGSERFFNDMREQFLQELIKEQVNLEMEKNKKVLRHTNNHKAGWIIHS